MPAKVSLLSKASTLHRLECGECGWTMSIYSENSADLKQCPWCRWGDLEISKLERSGAGQRLACSIHGEVVVEVLNSNISTDDFMDDMFCPFCERP